MKTILVSIVTLICFAACKKESDKIVSPVGFWKGAVAAGQDMWLIHRENKTVRLYLFPPVPQLDSSQAYKFEGQWQLNGNKYEANFSRSDSIDVEILMNALLSEPYGTITGYMRFETQSGATPTSFTILRKD